MIDYTVPTPDAITKAQNDTIAACDGIVGEIVGVAADQRTFANTMTRLEDVYDLLERAQGRYGFMAYVAEDADVRAKADELREALEKYEIELGFRDDLYAAVMAYARSDEARALEGEEKRLVEWAMRDYKRDGFGLPFEERQKVRELKQRLVELEITFRRNIDTWEDAIFVTREDLAGLPDAYIEGLTTEQRDGQTLYKVSLDYPEMYPFLDNAESEELRRELMLKNYRKGGRENITLLEEAIGVRDQLAKTLGYESWADYVLELRMAKDPETVESFLVDLRAKVKAKLDRDIDGLREAKRAHTGQPDAEVELWDARFYHNYLMKSRFAVDDFAVARYFPLDAVLKGLFDTMQTLLSVRFEELSQTNAWHPDVKLFRVTDASDGAEVGHFYMDLFPRPNKFGHAAAFTLEGERKLPDGSTQKPVSAIVANFTKPAAGQESLLRHTEVVTLFHEFGHILHQVLTRTSRLRFSGTRTERDFVEAPSQMLEHWVWLPEVLSSFSRHVETGEPLPKALLDSMVAAKNLDSGVFTMRQLFFSELDMAYHGPGSSKDTTAIARELHPIMGFPAPEDTYFQAGFGHLFGYDAGYYGYKWSEVFADDMFTRFEAEGPLNESIGVEYRSKVLERGGAVDGDVLVREFLGREPSFEAFLKNLGL